VRRRDFISLLGGAVAGWPLAARAQQPAKLPTIGYLGTAVPSAWSPWTAAFVQRLRELGWTEGRTVVIEYRWDGGPTRSIADLGGRRGVANWLSSLACRLDVRMQPPLVPPGS
jgi:putative ABC transport system substrate-binding protein